MSAKPAALAAPKQSTKGLNISIWVVQVLLILTFGMAGFGKLTSSIADLHAKMPWTLWTPDALVRFIGVSELAAALGMLLPSVTRIMPKLTALAAAGLV